MSKSLLDECWEAVNEWSDCTAKQPRLLRIFEDYARLKALEPAMNQVIDRVGAYPTAATAAEACGHGIAIVDAARKLAEAAK